MLKFASQINYILINNLSRILEEFLFFFFLNQSFSLDYYLGTELTKIFHVGLFLVGSLRSVDSKMDCGHNACFSLYGTVTNSDKWKAIWIFLLRLFFCLPSLFYMIKSSQNPFPSSYCYSLTTASLLDPHLCSLSH